MTNGTPELPVIPFDAATHADLGSDYYHKKGGKFIVDGAIKVSDIIFSSEDDDFSEMLGVPFRSADSCPADRTKMQAFPDEPRIKFRYPRQHLTATCEHRIEVAADMTHPGDIGGKSRVVYGVCMLKTMRADIRPGAVPMILDSPEKNTITCPFHQLNGMVVERDRRVDVTVDVHGIDDDAIYDFTAAGGSESE